MADFGTGRIASAWKIQEESHEYENVSSTIAEISEQTLSCGVGSLLWMAPEVLHGSRITAGMAPAVDIYRCVPASRMCALMFSDTDHVVARILDRHTVASPL